ncbi:MAG: sulfatase-like hydrolase/transferase [Balneolaceae bacterium]|nr:sulfatase-like hydrolase/transferase [Balneolaceae bacterium]
MALNTGCSTAPKNAEEQPNILLILADDLGFNDLGFQGSKDLSTPNLDTLARNGVIFTDAHVTASVCSPSRAGLITGKYQQFFGHEANIPPPQLGTDTTLVTIADVLRDNGYRTGINGKWHIGYEYNYHPNSRGFDHFWGFLGGHRSYFPENYPPENHKAIYTNRTHTPFTGNYLTDTQADEAVKFIKDSNEPFFLFLSLAAPHAPMHALEEDMARFPNSDRPEYAAMVYAMDRAVGKVVQHLKQTGKFENTLIVFLSDNGGSPVNDSNNSPLKGFKGNKFEGGIRVPFIVHWPKVIDGGQSFDGLTSSLDLFPTFLDAAGIKKSSELELDGTSLIPFLTNEKTGSPHDMLFFRKEMAAAVRHGNWKLIRLDDYGYVLYDLATDPYETTNLKNREPERFESMKIALENWESKTVEPWWSENPKWQEVTSDIHQDLMNNRPIRRISPD